jgi:hypothetical protein
VAANLARYLLAIGLVAFLKAFVAYSSAVDIGKQWQ